jgi:hypothetical protein
MFSRISFNFCKFDTFKTQGGKCPVAFSYLQHPIFPISFHTRAINQVSRRSRAKIQRRVQSRSFRKLISIFGLLVFVENWWKTHFAETYHPRQLPRSPRSIKIRPCRPMLGLLDLKLDRLRFI